MALQLGNYISTLIFNIICEYVNTVNCYIIARSTIFERKYLLIFKSVLYLHIVDIKLKNILNIYICSAHRSYTFLYFLIYKKNIQCPENN